MQDALRTYLGLAMGLTETSRKKVRKVVKDAVGRGNATADQVRAMSTDLMAANSANREALVKLVKFEVDRALGVVGLATAEEVAELTTRLRTLEGQLRGSESATAATPAGQREAAAKILADKAAASSTLPEGGPTRATRTRRAAATTSPATSTRTRATSAKATGAQATTAKATRPTAAKTAKSTATKATKATKATRARTTGAKATGAKATAAKATGTKATGAKAAGTKAAGTKAAGTKAAGTKATTAKATKAASRSTAGRVSARTATKASASKATRAKAARKTTRAGAAS